MTQRISLASVLSIPFSSSCCAPVHLNSHGCFKIYPCYWKHKDPRKGRTVFFVYRKMHINSVICKPKRVFINFANTLMCVQLQKNAVIILVKRTFLKEKLSSLVHLLDCVSFTLCEDVSLIFPCYGCLVELFAFQQCLQTSDQVIPPIVSNTMQNTNKIPGSSKPGGLTDENVYYSKSTK